MPSGLCQQLDPKMEKFWFAIRINPPKARTLGTIYIRISVCIKRGMVRGYFGNPNTQFWQDWPQRAALPKPCQSPCNAFLSSRKLKQILDDIFCWLRIRVIALWSIPWPISPCSKQGLTETGNIVGAVGSSEFWPWLLNLWLDGDSFFATHRECPTYPVTGYMLLPCCLGRRSTFVAYPICERYAVMFHVSASNLHFSYHPLALAVHSHQHSLPWMLAL